MKSHQSINKNKKTCKDTLWICLFVIFWCFLIVIIVFSNNYGNYTAVINGVDSYGNICNISHNKRFENFTLSGTDTSKKPYLLYFDTKNFDGVVKICVETCPPDELKRIMLIFRHQVNIPTQLCSYDVNVLKDSMAFLAFGINVDQLRSRLGPCPANTMRSFQFKNRCIPDKEHEERRRRFDLRESYDLLNAGGLDQLFFIAVYQSWNYVAVLCGFAFGISLIILILMFSLPKFLPWLICLATIITNTILCNELWSNYYNYPFDLDLKDEEGFEFKILFKSEGDYDFYEQFDRVLWDLLDEFKFNSIFIFYLALFTMCLTVMFINLTLIWMLHLNQLKLLFNEASNCMKNLPGLIIAPTIALLSMILLIFLSGYTLLCITTSKFPIISPTIDEFYDWERDIFRDRRLFQQIEYVDSKAIRRTFWIFIIGMLWTTEFIYAFEEFCIGAAVGFWYFTPSINNPSLKAIGILFKNHLGTIAKGSAVIALVKVPRLIYSLTFKRIKSRINQLWLRRVQFLEERIEIWNHNAYVPSAMETSDLCSAAEVVWKIMSKNGEEIEKLKTVFGFVLFVSKFFVAILTCLVGVILMKDRKDYLFNKDRHEYFFYMAPVLFSTLCAYCIAHIVFSVVEMIVDALFLCTCEDHQKNCTARCFIMRSSLMKLFKNNGENAANKTNT